MTDAQRDNSKKRYKVTPEDFARFLSRLSLDPEEAGLYCIRLHKRLAGIFRLQGDPDPESGADATIDRAAMKMAAGAVVPKVETFCIGIARNIAKERLRWRLRENLAFQTFVNDISNAASEHVERIYSKLKPCFERLAVKDQELLLTYYHDMRGRARSEHRRQIAEAEDTSSEALRVRVTRLRKSLMECLKERSNED